MLPNFYYGSFYIHWLEAAWALIDWKVAPLYRTDKCVKSYYFDPHFDYMNQLVLICYAQQPTKKDTKAVCL